MSNNNITRLVVGGPMEISLGVPVGQGVQESDVSKTLRWKEGRWESGASFLVQAKLKLATNTESKIRIPLKPSENTINRLKNVGLIVCALTLIGLLAWASGSLMQGGTPDKPQVAPGLPFGAKSNNTVKLVDEPFPLPGAEPVQPVDAAPAEGKSTNPKLDSGVIIPEVRAVEAKEVAAMPPSAPKSEPAPAPIQVRAAAKPEVKSAPTDNKASKTEDKDQKPVAHAVILDVGPEVKAPSGPTVVIGKVPTPVMATPIEVKPSMVSKPLASASPAQTPVVQTTKPTQVAKSGNSLVALSPDGRFALFTNQKTRLPEKFSVGEKLPTGDVIKSIDTAAGKVITDSKEYRLE